MDSGRVAMGNAEKLNTDDGTWQMAKLEQARRLRESKGGTLICAYGTLILTQNKRLVIGGASGTG